MDESLIVTEINSDQPLSLFLRSRRQLRTLEEAGHHFGPHRPDTVVRIVCDSGVLLPAGLPFRAHSSVSHGGNVPLEWRESLSGSSLDPTLRLVARINKSFQR